MASLEAGYRLEQNLKIQSIPGQYHHRKQSSFVPQQAP